MRLDSHNLYSVSQIRSLEKMAVDDFSIPESELMQRAGSAAFALLRVRWPEAAKILVLAGKGNNGGDGMILAELAADAGFDVMVRHIDRKECLVKYAAAFNPDETWSADVIVDALLGIGIKGDVSEEYRLAIEKINEHNAPVLAVDVPSGVDADTGSLHGVAVHADVTMTYLGLKQGLFTGHAVDFVGEVNVDTLGLPTEAFDKVQPNATLLQPQLISTLLPARHKDTHKGECGHVLVVGGHQGMPGAVKMAAEAAARVGAGLVSIATHPDHATTLNMSRPELMCHAVESEKALLPLFERATVIVVGPGLGRDAWSETLWSAVLKTKHPKVVDADALFQLANKPEKSDNWIITPHPGEAGQLLQSSAQAVQQNRFDAANQLQQKYGGCVVLKGAGSLIRGTVGPTKVCRFGNPGMASGGMGDVLSGVVGGLLAQGLTTTDAASCGVLIHALAADRAAALGERGLLAQDVIDALRPTIADLTNEH